VTVVFLSVSGALGGAERVLLDLLWSLRRARPGWRLHLLAGADGPLPRAAEALGVPARVLPLPAAFAGLGDAGLSSRLGMVGAVARMALAYPRGRAYLGRLRRELRALRPDVVHSNGFKMHMLAAAARPAGAAVVWHLHDFTGNRPLMRHALRRYRPRASGAVAVSRAVAHDARELVGPALRIEVVPNAVDLERFSPGGARADLDALAGLPAAPAGTVRVGLVATMGKWKGHALFLRALAALPLELPWRGYVVGGAIYETRGSETPLAELKRLAAELGLAERVGFTGFVDEPADAMRALDVVVHASTEPEPFGLVIAEAMACARAVVVSAGGGAAEIASPGKDALDFPPGDEHALAEQLRHLIEDPDLRGRLGTEGRRTAERDFDRARLGPQVARLYEALAG
jgi:glycosyltransferase involved in cell wall biosynthesis